MQRSNFFTGQYVDSDDLNYIESSKISAIQSVIKAISPLSGSYTKAVSGLSQATSTELQVQQGTTSSQITVLPGTAFDNDGNRIYVPSDTGSRTPAYPEREDLTWSSGAGLTYVKVAYQEASGSVEQDDYGVNKYTRYYDSYAITIDQIAPTANELLLASFTSTAGNAISGLVSDERRILGHLPTGDNFLLKVTTGSSTYWNAGSTMIRGSGTGTPGWGLQALDSVSVMGLFGDQDTSSGGRIRLYGANAASTPGSIALIADTGSVGGPDGIVSVLGDLIPSGIFAYSLGRPFQGWKYIYGGSIISGVSWGLKSVGDDNVLCLGGGTEWEAASGSYISMGGISAALADRPLKLYGTPYVQVISRFDVGSEDDSQTMFFHTTALNVHNSGSSPSIVFDRERSTLPATSDVVASLSFRTTLEDGVSVNYGSHRVVVDSSTVGSESGKHQWYLINSGTSNLVMELDSTGVLSVDASGGGAPATVDVFDDYDDPVLVEDLVKERNIDELRSLGLVNTMSNGRTSWNIQPVIRLLAGSSYQLRDRIDEKVSSLSDRLSRVESALQLT